MKEGDRKGEREEGREKERMEERGSKAEKYLLLHVHVYTYNYAYFIVAIGRVIARLSHTGILHY